MGEYSTVNIETRTGGWMYGQAEAFGLMVKAQLDWDFDILDPKGSVPLGFPVAAEKAETGWNLRWEEDQARYGFEGDELVAKLTAMLTERRIPWWALDYGHWDWDETEYAWQPGMVRPAERFRGTQGAVLTEIEFHRLYDKDRSRTQEDDAMIVDRLIEHFGEVPNLWLSA